MTQLRLIGYWIESLIDSKYFAPQEFVGSLRRDQKRRIVRYLRRGTTFEVYRGHSWCRFCCGARDEQMGGSELTDGYWVWPSGLAHYVARHDVVLPDEFTSHMLADGPQGHQDAALSRPSDVWWLGWCAAHSSGALRPQLDGARARAETLRRDEHARWASLLEAKNGVCDRTCTSNGCERRAMQGWAWCGLCSLGVGGEREINVIDRTNLAITEGLLLREVLRSGAQGQPLSSAGGPFRAQKQPAGTMKKPPKPAT